MKKRVGDIIRLKLPNGQYALGRMNIEKLKIVLEYCGVPHNMYSLIGGLPSEAYCIMHYQNHWEVYYSEHGNKNCLQEFNSEAEACVELLTRILTDSYYRTNRLSWLS